MNQRRSMRFPVTDGETTVRLSDGQLNYGGTILNESFGGLAVICSEVVPWAVGSPVKVQYHGVWERAVLRRNEADGDRSELGLEWMPVPSQGDAGRQAATTGRPR